MSSTPQEIIARLNDDKKNLYEKLGVRSDASLETITNAMMNIASQLGNYNSSGTDFSAYISALDTIETAGKEFANGDTRELYDLQLSIEADLSPPITMSSTPAVTDTTETVSASVRGSLQLDNYLARDNLVSEQLQIDRLLRQITTKLDNDPSQRLAIIVPKKSPYSDDLNLAIDNLDMLYDTYDSNGVVHRIETQQIYHSNNAATNMNDMRNMLEDIDEKLKNGWDVGVSQDPFYPQEPKNIEFDGNNYSQEDFFSLMLGKLKYEHDFNLSEAFQSARVIPNAPSLTQPLPAATLTASTTPGATATTPQVITTITTTFTAEAPTSDWASIVAAYNKNFQPAASPDSKRLDFSTPQEANDFLTRQAMDDPSKKFICRGAGAGGTPQQDYFMVSLGDGEIHKGTCSEVQKQLREVYREAGDDFAQKKDVLKNMMAVEKSMRGESTEYHNLKREFRLAESKLMSAEATAERELATRNDSRVNNIQYGVLPAQADNTAHASEYGVLPAQANNTAHASEYGVLPTLPDKTEYGKFPVDVEHASTLNDDYDSLTNSDSRTSGMSGVDDPRASTNYGSLPELAEEDAEDDSIDPESPNMQTLYRK